MNKQNCWFGGAVVGVVSVYVFLSIKKSSNSPCLFLSHQSEFISFLKSLLIGPWERLQPLGTQGCLMYFSSLFCGFLHVQLLFPTEQIWSLKLGMLCLFFFFWNSMGTLTLYSPNSDTSPMLVNLTGCLILFSILLIANRLLNLSEPQFSHLLGGDNSVYFRELWMNQIW